MSFMNGESAGRSDRESRTNAVDIHVGSRIRTRRAMLGYSQERLASALGLTFQQVQKYERGTNRVGASRLFHISRILDVPISYFFDNLSDDLLVPPLPESHGRSYGFAEQPQPFNADEEPISHEAHELVRAYYRISDPIMRSRMLDLIKSLGAHVPQLDSN